MQQFVIKLSSELTRKYLDVVKTKAKAEASQDMENSGVTLDLKLILLPGVDLLNQISVNGEDLTFKSDDVVIEINE